jgi:hypothetical protein
MSRALNDAVKTIKNECKKLCAAYHPNKESSPERKDEIGAFGPIVPYQFAVRFAARPVRPAEEFLPTSFEVRSAPSSYSTVPLRG